jgi:hypothetical protein
MLSIFSSGKATKITSKEQFLAWCPTLSPISESLFLLSDRCEYDALQAFYEKAGDMALPVFTALTNATRIIRSKRDFQKIAKKLIRLAGRKKEIFSKVEVHHEPEYSGIDYLCSVSSASASAALIVEQSWKKLVFASRIEDVKYGLAVLSAIPWGKIDSKRELSKEISTSLKVVKKKMIRDVSKSME